MKKKIFGGIAVLAIAAMATFNISIGSETNNISDIMLANIEALADEGSWSLSDAMWHVTVQIYPEVTVTCTSGGTYKCD